MRLSNMSVFYMGLSNVAVYIGLSIISVFISNISVPVYEYMWCYNISLSLYGIIYYHVSIII